MILLKLGGIVAFVTTSGVLLLLILGVLASSNTSLFSSMVHIAAQNRPSTFKIKLVNTPLTTFFTSLLALVSWEDIVESRVSIGDQNVENTVV